MTTDLLSGDHLAYPVLCLSHDTSIVVAACREELERCNAYAFFRNRYFEDLLVLDATARQFKVVSSRPHPPLSGLSLWLTRVRNTKLAVRLELKESAAASLDASKHQVTEWLDKDPEFWEASRDLGEWKRLVNDSRTMHQLIALFT